MQEAMQNLLNNREQSEFIEILNDYHARRNVSDFSNSMKNILDTPAKMHLASMIRSVLPSADVPTFDQIMGVPYETNSLPRMPKHGNLYKAASTMSIPGAYYQTVPTRGAKTLRRSVPQNLHKLTQLPAFEANFIGDIKIIHLDPPSNAGLGFSIRGGAEHGIGIYVSYVDVESVAEKCGLVPGDQILSVNGHSFDKISHSDAAKVWYENY